MSRRRPIDPVRRRLLQRSLGLLAPALALGASGRAGAVEPAAMATGPDADEGYRALVCVYLNGGNDSFNLLVPTADPAYAAYAAARQGLAVRHADLLAARTAEGTPAPLGWHPRAAALRTLFERGRLAIQSNVGPLQVPTTKAMVQAGQALPPVLYSHADQSAQWMSGRSDAPDTQGWGGRLADRLQARFGGTDMPICISLAGANLFQTGAETLPYGVDPSGGVPVFAGIQSYDPAWRRAGFETLLQQSLADPSLLVREGGRLLGRTRQLAGRVVAALEPLSLAPGTLPDSLLGQQLQQVARLILARQTLGLRRQIFFVEMGGFDTHSGQAERQPQLFAELDAALAAFQAWTEGVGLDRQVTSFTLSDFGRTLTSNHGGTDHGWGAHQLVIGGAVHGGRILGELPDLALGGACDADGAGRIIPGTSVSQYGAALARWMGATADDLAGIFPDLSRFPAGIPPLLPA